MRPVLFPSQGSLFAELCFLQPLLASFSLLVFAPKGWAGELALMRVLLMTSLAKMLIYTTGYAYVPILQHCLLTERFTRKTRPEVCELCLSKRWKRVGRKRLYFPKSTNKICFNPFRSFKHKKSRFLVWNALNELGLTNCWPTRSDLV